MGSCDDVIDGMARIFWASAWAQHVDDCSCSSLSGCEITEIMPSVLTAARDTAWRALGKIEQANGMDIHALYARAMRADGRSETDYSLETHFGECLAFAVMGDGVGWEDDHAGFGLIAPRDGGMITGDLMALFMRDNEDADTGDAFLQCCLFGDVIYG